MSYIALFCISVAIATLQNGGVHGSNFLGSSGFLQRQLPPSLVKLSKVQKQNGKFAEAHDPLTARLGHDHSITKRQGIPFYTRLLLLGEKDGLYNEAGRFGAAVLAWDDFARLYSPQQYGAALPKFKPTPSPVQEKFFKEQIKSLPLAARERLKRIYASTGFTQEFQELLMRELVRPQDQSAGQDGAGKQSVASNNGAPNFNEDQFRGRPTPENNQRQPDRISTEGRPPTASGRTSAMHNQYVYSQGDVRAEGGVGHNAKAGNAAFDSNAPQGPSDYNLPTSHYPESSTFNDNPLQLHGTNEHYGISRVTLRAPPGQQHRRPIASGESNQQNVLPWQMTQQVTSKVQIYPKQLDPHYQQQQQHLASNQQRYITSDKQQSQYNQRPRVPNQQNFIQNQQETISNQNQLISTPQRQRQQYVQNGQQKLTQNQRDNQQQFHQNQRNHQQQFVRKPQSYQNHQLHQAGPNLQKQVLSNALNQPHQAQSNYQYQHPQMSSRQHNGRLTHNTPTAFTASQNQNNFNPRAGPTHPMEKPASPTSPLNTAQQTLSGNADNRNRYEQYRHHQNSNERHNSNNVDVRWQNNVNSGSHADSQNVNRFSSFSQPADNLHIDSQIGHNLQAGLNRGHDLHASQQPVNNLQTGQQLVNNLQTGQQLVISLPTGQQPVNNLQTGQQLVNNLPTGQQPVNNLHAGQHPVNNLHAGQQPVNNLHSGQQPVNNLHSVAQPVSIENYTAALAVPTQTPATTVTPTTVQPPQTQTTPPTPMPPSPVIDFLNTKIIIPPHINDNPAMRAAFIKVISSAMGRSQAEKKEHEIPTTATPLSITTSPVTAATQMPAPIPNVAPTTSTTVRPTTATTTSLPLYNQSVQLAPALYLTWSLPQAQIDSLRGSTLSTILKSINASRSEQMPGNTFVEGFKSFLIDILLADPLSYVPSLDGLLPHTYYERLDHGATILIKDILGGFVRFEPLDLANRVKRSLSGEIKSKTLNKIDQKWTSTSKSSTKCTGEDFCDSSSTKVPIQNLGILGIVEDQMVQFINNRYTNKNALTAFETSSNLKNMKLIWGDFPTVRNNLQILKVHKQQDTINFFRDNEDFICTLFETLSQRNKCMINLRNHHIKRSHLQCRKILTTDEKSKCKRKVVQGVLRRSCARKDEGQEGHVAMRVQKEGSRLRGCDRQRHSLKKRAASGTGVKSVPVLRFTWLLPKDSFPAAPLETMQYIMDKYKAKISVTKSTSVVANKETTRGNPPERIAQQGAEINDPIAYLNKIIEAANALSKLQGKSVDVLAGALHLPVSRGDLMGMILKSHARVESPGNLHTNAQISTPPIPDLVSFMRTPSLTTHTMEFASTTQAMLENRKPPVHVPSSVRVISSLPILHVQGAPPALLPPEDNVESLVLTMSSKFKNVPQTVLRTLIAQLVQQFHSETPTSTAYQTFTGMANAQPTNVVHSYIRQPEMTNLPLPSMQMSSHVTDRTPSHHSISIHETVTSPSVTEMIVPPQVPPPTADTVVTKSSPDPIKSLPDQLSLSEITSPPFRVSTYPLSTMSVVANKYLMNIHFKGLPPLDLTTLPSIGPYSQTTSNFSNALPTSASPAEIADFMRYLMSTLRYSGHIIPEASPSHEPLRTLRNSALSTPSLVSYSGKANNPVANPQQSFTQINPLPSLDSNSKSNINTPITIKLSPSMESMTPMSHLSDHLFRPHQLSLADSVTINPVFNLNSGSKNAPAATPISSSSSLNNNLSSNVVSYVNSALNNILMSHPATINVHESHNHANQAKESTNAVSDLGGARGVSHGDLSIPSPAVLLQSKYVNTQSHFNHNTDLSPNKISVEETHISPILKSSLPNEVKTPDVNIHRETHNQAGNYIQETAPASQYEFQSLTPTSVCPLGQTMECKPTRPSARLVSFCLERCDQLSGVCGSALCSCECLGPDTPPRAPKALDAPAILAEPSKNALRLDALHSDGFQISIVNPDLPTTTTTQSPSLTTSEDRLRTFLSLLEKVKGKRPEATTEEPEPADK